MVAASSARRQTLEQMLTVASARCAWRRFGPIDFKNALERPSQAGIINSLYLMSQASKLFGMVGGGDRIAELDACPDKKSKLCSTKTGAGPIHLPSNGHDEGAVGLLRRYRETQNGK
ncbi:MAG: hypothetical protein WBF03_03835 [Xanthobacteraceae bacterium]